MRYVSLFSGIEAASVAWQPLGWEAVAFAEIEPFPCAVLAERFPNVPNLGDVCKIDWEEFREKYGSVEIVCGGSPCQSFSIAGGRESLEGESRLMFEYIRAVQELRPRWYIWENVPGVLNTKDDAFGFFLDQMDEFGYSTAWRVLDAQFFAVAQRRRRVWAVGASRDAFGDLAAGRAAAVLFERDSLRGNTITSREKRARLAASTERGAGGSYTLKLRHTGSENRGGGQGPLIQDDVSATLATSQDQTLFCMATQQGGAEIAENFSPTITSAAGMSGNNQPVLYMATATQYGSEVAGTLTARGDSSPCADRGQNIICMATAAANAEIAVNQSPTLLAECAERPIVCVGSDSSKASVDEEVCGTLHVGGGSAFIAGAVPTCAEFVDSMGAKAGNIGYAEEQAPTVKTVCCGSVLNRMEVRRLTPLECERLQGFPDGWTDIPYKGKQAPDTARYKALGNSWAVPCARWIGERLETVDAL